MCTARLADVATAADSDPRVGSIEAGALPNGPCNDAMIAIVELPHGASALLTVTTLPTAPAFRDGAAVLLASGALARKPFPTLGEVMRSFSVGTVDASNHPDFKAGDAVQGIVQGIRADERELGIIGRLIPAIDREATPREALEMVQWVVAQRVDEVIGIGIDYREVDRPPELFTEAYAAARRAGFKTTAHAGEFGTPWHNVLTALDVLKVDRIDHGYTVVDAPAFAERCAERGLVFTVVPTNSYYLRTLPPERWALDHPIRRMPAMGLRVHPNTDDPTLHHVTPTGAWLMMSRDFGFSLDELRGFMLNGLDAAWVDDGTRQRWRGEFCAAFDALRAQHLDAKACQDANSSSPPPQR